MINIVLHEPEIPFNTGAIGRTCVATDSSLHMIGPYGFTLSDKYIKRAGMDYWPKLDLHEYVDYEDFLNQNDLEFGDGRVQGISGTQTVSGLISDSESPDGNLNREDAVPVQSQAPDSKDSSRPRLWFATTKAHQTYADVHFGPNDYIMFGKESAGIPEEILSEHEYACIRIPMWGDVRSLNLSNSASIILYEALRQNHFEELKQEGSLHRLQWKNNTD